MPKPVFSRDDYFQMLDKLLAPEPLQQNGLILERLRESIKKRDEFGLELPRLNISTFNVS